MHDGLLERRVSLAVRRLLKPIPEQPVKGTKHPSRARGKRKSVHEISLINLPYVPKAKFAVLLAKRSKSTSKDKGYRNKHMATYSTIRKLLRLHRERKHAAQAQHSENASLDEGTRLAAQGIDLSVFCSMAKSDPKTPQPGVDSKDFAKHSDRMRLILANTIKLRAMTNEIARGRADSPTVAVTRLAPPASVKHFRTPLPVRPSVPISEQKDKRPSDESATRLPPLPAVSPLRDRAGRRFGTRLATQDERRAHRPAGLKPRGQEDTGEPTLQKRLMLMMSLRVDRMIYDWNVEREAGGKAETARPEDYTRIIGGSDRVWRSWRNARRRSGRRSYSSGRRRKRS